MNYDQIKFKKEIIEINETLFNAIKYFEKSEIVSELINLGINVLIKEAKRIQSLKRD